MTTWLEIAERAEKAEGSDRELDAAVVAELNSASVRRYPPTDDYGPKNRWQFWSRDGAHFLGSESRFKVPPLTSSVDAVLALIEEKLPGWNVTMASAYRSISIMPLDPDSYGIHDPRAGHSKGKAATIPLALLAALARALTQGEERG